MRMYRDGFWWAPETGAGGGAAAGSASASSAGGASTSSATAGSGNGNKTGAGGSGAAGSAAATSSNTEPGLEYESWLEKQSADVKVLLEGHVRGLKSALDSEREGRKKLEREIRDLAGKAEKGSQAEAQLTQVADKIAEGDRKAEFYEAAHAAGVTNLKLAYLAAVQEDMFDKHGRVNFEAMRQTYPELFGGAKKPPAGTAGNGTRNAPDGHQGMNDFIRAAAGRR